MLFLKMYYSVLTRDSVALVALAAQFLVYSAQAITLPSSYDTIWTSQSSDSSGSMPLGGGDIGLNAWAENGKSLSLIS